MSKYPEIHEFDGAEFIRCADFDRVTAERDAALAQEVALARDAANWKRKACESADREAALQALLTAADELNDVMAGLLRDARQCHGVALLTDPPQDAWKYHRISERIDAALNLADRQPCKHCGWPHIKDEETCDAATARERGRVPKDEHICSGCGSKGWTASCAECVPY